MKKRVSFLVILLVVSLALVSLLAWLAEGPRAEPAHATAAPSDQATVFEVAPDDPSRIAPAIFPHDDHVMKSEIECEICHHETSAAPLSFPHTDYFDDFWIDCTICHREAGTAALTPQKCSNCHHPQNGDIADETRSAKVVVHKNCWSCHEAGTGADASASCTFCHPE